jgi:hypothetical protein
MAGRRGDAANPPLLTHFRSWLLEGLTTQSDQLPGPHQQPTPRHQHPWWRSCASPAAGGIFLKGFTEAIGIAVGLVAVYLALNLVVVAVALEHLVANPHLVVNWEQLLTTSLARRSRGADVQTR